MNEKIAFLKNSGIYFVGDFLSKLITFFLLPIYSKYILPADFGYFDLTTSYLMLLIPLVTAEIWIGMLRFIKEDKNNSNAIISAGFYIVLLNFALVLIAVVLNEKFEFNIRYFNLICALGILFLLQKYYVYLCRSISSNKVFICSGILNTVVAGSTNYIMIIYFKMGLESLFAAAIFGLIAQVVLIEFYTKLHKKFSITSFDFNLITRLVKFSFPISLGSILYFFLIYYSKIVLEKKIGLSANGFLAIASKFTIAIVFLTSAFTMAWQDLSFSMGENKSNYKKYENAIALYTKVLLAGSGVVVFVLHFIFPLMIDKKYDASYNIIPLSAVAVVLSAIGNFISQTLGAIKKTQIIIISSIVSTVFNLLFVGYFIEKFGINGLNISLIFTFLINIIIRFGYLKIKLKMNIQPFLIPILLLYLSLILFVYFTRNSTYNFVGLVVSVAVFVFLLKQEFNLVIKKGLHYLSNK